jgi:hypothetical protein
MTTQHLLRRLLRSLLCLSASCQGARQDPRLTAVSAARPSHRLV